MKRGIIWMPCFKISTFYTMIRQCYQLKIKNRTLLVSTLKFALSFDTIFIEQDIVYKVLLVSPFLLYYTLFSIGVDTFLFMIIISGLSIYIRISWLTLVLNTKLVRITTINIMHTTSKSVHSSHAGTTTHLCKKMWHKTRHNVRKGPTIPRRSGNHPSQDNETDVKAI